MRRTTNKTDPTPDLLAGLGELGLASRLRRASERLLRDVSRVYSELAIDFEARWFPLFFALRQHAPRGVTDLARDLELTHPAVNQLAAEMEAKGLLRAGRDTRDNRRRLLRLSARGEQVARRLDPVWNEIRAANRDLLDQLRDDGHDLLSALGALEGLLDQESMYDRVRRRVSADDGERAVAAGPRERLEIVRYRPAWRRHFESLNREWLEERFSVEPADAAVLADPYGSIVKPGGMVFFARLDGEVVGTCALIRHRPGLFELAKMAVSPARRSHGIGRRLAETVLAEARARKARMVFLETSPRMIAVRRWYGRLGFRRIDTHPLGISHYIRKSLTMSMNLAAPAVGERKGRSR